MPRLLQPIRKIVVDLMWHQQRTFPRSRSPFMLFCYVCCLLLFPETTPYEESIETSIRQTTTRASDEHTELMSTATVWHHWFCRHRGTPDKGMEWTDAVSLQDNARTEEEGVTSFSQRRDLATRLDERNTSRRKSILNRRVPSKASETRSRNTALVRLKIGDKAFLKKMYRNLWGPHAFGHLPEGELTGIQGHRVRRSEASIEDGTLEDLFSDAYIFSERALDSDLKKSVVGVSEETEVEDLNFDADEEAVEAAEEESLEKRDVDDTVITKTLMKDLEDKIYNHAVTYIEENHLEPIQYVVTTTKQTVEQSLSPMIAPNTLDNNRTTALNASIGTVSVTPNVGNIIGSYKMKSNRMEKKLLPKWKSTRRKGNRGRKKKLGALARKKKKKNWNWSKYNGPLQRMEKKQRKMQHRKGGLANKKRLNKVISTSKKTKKARNKEKRRKVALIKKNKNRTKKKKTKKRHDIKKKKKKRKTAALTKQNKYRTKKLEKTKKRNKVKKKKKKRKMAKNKNGKKTRRVMKKNMKKGAKKTKKKKRKGAKRVRKKKNNENDSSSENVKNKEKKEEYLSEKFGKEIENVETGNAFSSEKERNKGVFSTTKRYEEKSTKREIQASKESKKTKTVLTKKRKKKSLSEIDSTTYFTPTNQRTTETKKDMASKTAWR